MTEVTMKSMFRLTMAMMLLSLGTACEAITGPGPIIDQFSWEGVENPDQIQEGVDIAGFSRNVNFLGQMKTPTLCYAISSSLDVDGSTLTINVEAKSSGSSNCAQTPGGFRYTGVVRNLDHGTYTVRIIQTVAGQTPQEFSEEVTL
jgi:hypothetical protein